MALQILNFEGLDRLAQGYWYVWDWGWGVKEEGDKGGGGGGGGHLRSMQVNRPILYKG